MTMGTTMGRMIRHHPTEATLLAYAAGTLPEALGLVLATHLTHCPDCRDAVRTAEAAGGALLDSLPPAPMAVDAGVVDQVLARADLPGPLPPPVLNPDLAPPLNRVQLGRWWPISGGVRWRPLHVGGRAWGGLLLAQPGRRLPSHGHEGLELTCLLAGAFADGGEEYGAGDIAEPEADHDTPPVAIGGEPCVCIVASEGLRFRGLLGVAQRLGGW
jgi:putative transcriptional regulator